MSETPFIVYEYDGVPAHLFGEQDWRDAIRDGRITRDTRVGLFRAGAGRNDVLAGQVDELRPIFDAFDLGRLAEPGATVEPTAPVPPADVGAAAPYHPVSPGPAFGQPPPAAQAGPPSWTPPPVHAQGSGSSRKIWVALGATLVIVLLAVGGMMLLNRRPIPVSNTVGAMAQRADNQAAATNTEIPSTPAEIDVVVNNSMSANSAATMSMAPPDEPPPPGASLEDQAGVVVGNYYSAWSPSNNVSWVEGVYAPDPIYYGARQTRQGIMGKQSDLIARWPSRSFAIVPGSTSTTCNASAQTCTVRGQVDISYFNSGQGTSMSGRAEYTFITSATGGSTVITSESGRMLSRR